jgi:hypothetical protein
MPAEPAKGKKTKIVITLFSVAAIVLVYCMSAFGFGIGRPEAQAVRGLRTSHMSGSFHAGK